MSESPTQLDATADTPVGTDSTTSTMLRPGLRLRLAAVAAALTAGSALVLVLDLRSPVRLLVALAFVLLVPGWSVVGLLRLEDPAANLTLSTTTSLVLGILVAQLLVWQHSYSVGLTFTLLAALSLVGLAVQVAGDLAALRAATGRSSS